MGKRLAQATASAVGAPGTTRVTPEDMGVVHEDAGDEVLVGAADAHRRVAAARQPDDFDARGAAAMVVVGVVLRPVDVAAERRGAYRMRHGAGDAARRDETLGTALLGHDVEAAATRTVATVDDIDVGVV